MLSLTVFFYLFIFLSDFILFYSFYSFIVLQNLALGFLQYFKWSKEIILSLMVNLLISDDKI